VLWRNRLFSRTPRETTMFHNCNHLFRPWISTPGNPGNLDVRSIFRATVGVFRRRLDHQIDLHGGKKQTRNQISLNPPPFRTKIHVRTIQGLCVKRSDLGNLKFRNNSDSKMNQSETAPEVTPCYPLFFPFGVECGRYAVAALPLSPHPACVCHAGDQHAQPLHRRKSSLWYR
jgi:hypothetical protein